MRFFLKLIFIFLLYFSIVFQLYSLDQSNVIMEIYFFYMEICHGCDSFITAEQFSAIVDNLSKNITTITGESFNIINENNSKQKKEILEQKNLSQLSYVLPLLIINESYFVGYEEIGEKLFELKSMFICKHK